MKKTIWKIVIPIVAVVLLLIVLIVIGQRKTSNTMISEFGKYQGYSEALYDGTQRTSDYLTLSDGQAVFCSIVLG